MNDAKIDAILGGKALLKDSSGNLYKFLRVKPYFRYVFRNICGNTRSPLHGDNSYIELSWEVLKTNPWYDAKYREGGEKNEKV